MTDDKRTELQLEELAELLPPDSDDMRVVTPWWTAMNRVLWGMGLNVFTLNVLSLNIFLPALGDVLTLLGFRSLRRENAGFRLCWWVSVFNCLLSLPRLVINATIWQADIYAREPQTLMTLVLVTLEMLLVVGLHLGLRQARQKAELPPKGAPALVVWYGVLMVLALVKVQSWLVVLAMVTAWIFILRGLIGAIRTLDVAGYVLSPAPVRISDRALGGGLALLVCAGMLWGYLFCYQYPMDWQPAPSEEETETARHLLDLGFPQTVLADLTAAEIESCGDAVRVVVQTDLTDMADRTTYESEANKRLLAFTHVAVKLPDAPNGDSRWQIFHHFHWRAKPLAFGTDVIQLWTAGRGLEESWKLERQPSGRLLYNRDNLRLTADYYNLTQETYTSTSVWGLSRTYTDWFAAYSLPRGGEDYRGYLTYGIRNHNDDWMIDSWCNFVTPVLRVQYPVQTALDARKGGRVSRSFFQFYQAELQFYPTRE